MAIQEKMLLDLSAGEVRAVAVCAAAHPKSVAKYLRGEHVRGHVEVRIAAALAELGYRVPTEKE